MTSMTRCAKVIHVAAPDTSCFILPPLVIGYSGLTVGRRGSSTELCLSAKSLPREPIELCQRRSSLPSFIMSCNSLLRTFLASLPTLRVRALWSLLDSKLLRRRSRAYLGEAGGSHDRTITM